MRRLTQDPERVRRLRLRAGLKLPELAERAGISKGTLWRVENGRGSANADTLHAIATALGCPVDDLMPPEATKATS